MPKPGARGPPDRGAPSPKDPRATMDRTVSLPNLGTATSGAATPAEPRQSEQNSADKQRKAGRISPGGIPASPASPPNPNISAPPMCRRVPARTPAPSVHAETTRAQRENFSEVSPTTRSGELSLSPTVRAGTSPAHSVTRQTRAATTSASTARAAHPPTLAAAHRAAATQRPAQCAAMHSSSAPIAAVRAPMQNVRADNYSFGHGTRTNRDPRSNCDTRHQMAPPSTSVIGRRAPLLDSPAPPRTSAYDSPARRSGQSSLSVSITSLASEGHGAGINVQDLMSPASPTPSMEIEYDFQAGARALRRRRSRRRGKTPALC